MTAPGGTLVPVTVVERLMLSTLQEFLPFWLGVSERAMGYAKDTLPNVVTWGVPRGWLQKPTPNSALPYVAFVSPGMAEPPVFHGSDDTYSVTWAMEATCGIAARDFDAADRLAKAYSAAIAGCVLNQLPGEPVEQIDWVRDDYPIIGADNDSVIIEATNVFAVKCSDVLQRRVGVSEVPDDPRDPPADYPTVETVELTAEHLS